MWTTLFSGLRLAAIVYFGLALFLAVAQRRMMYFPLRCSEAEVLRFAAREGLLPWRNEAGELIGWQPANAQAQGNALLLFHGNAGFAAHRSYFVQGFSPEWTVYLFEYPSYGARPGSPSEARFVSAAESAFLQLGRERAGRIFLGGESLGGGVACHLAAKHPDRVAGLFLATPFSSLTDVARHHYPFFPVRWLMRDRYDCARLLKKYSGPLAVLLAGQDEVVPAHLGRKLFEGYTGPKRLWVQEAATHNTLDYTPARPWWREVIRFLEESQ